MLSFGENRAASSIQLNAAIAHRAIRLLDPVFRDERNLRFDEISLPLRPIAELPVTNATVFIVENNLNLLTLPPFPRGIAIRGEGNAVN